MGRYVASVLTLALVAALSCGVVVATAAPASAAVQGTLHVQYDVDGTFKQQDDTSSLPRTSEVTINWKVSSDIPLAGSSVPYRYSDRKSKQGTVNANAAKWTNGPTTCTGPLTVVDANGLQNVAQFEFDYAKKGSTLLDKGTLKGTSPVPITSGFVAQFSDANGAGCTGYQPVTQIGGSPDDPAGNVLLKVDLAKLAKSKSKSQTFKVGLTKTFDQNAKTDVDWHGTVVVTLKK
ncbi:MAG TPA: hypothetical protein VH986_13255 [Acidimicrobiia bacterium]|jgi:hypothetical protein